MFNDLDFDPREGDRDKLDNLENLSKKPSNFQKTTLFIIFISNVDAWSLRIVVGWPTYPEAKEFSELIITQSRKWLILFKVPCQTNRKVATKIESFMPSFIQVFLLFPSKNKNQLLTLLFQHFGSSAAWLPGIEKIYFVYCMSCCMDLPGYALHNTYGWKWEKTKLKS